MVPLGIQFHFTNYYHILCQSSNQPNSYLCPTAGAVNTALQMEGSMSKLKQIGPRVRLDIAEKLKEYCKEQRVSSSMLVEKLIAQHLEASGYDIEDYNRN